MYPFHRRTNTESTATNGISFVMVGSGAVRVNCKRGGPSQIVRIGHRVLLFDCGRCAVHNMVRFGFPVEDIHRVFITHLHFDHVCDLAYFVLLSWNNGRSETLRIYGPPGIGQFLEHSVRHAYKQDIESRLAHGKDPSGLDWEVVEIRDEGPFLKEEQYVISVLSTEHAGLPNLNYRLDSGSRRVVLTSDTQPDEALVRFCEGADLLVCECSGTADFLSSQPWGGWHMTPESVGRLAKDAGVKKVVIKHLVIENFSPDPCIAEKMVQQIRDGYAGEVTVGFDGLQVDLKT